MAEIRTSHLLTLKLAVSGMQPIGETPGGNRRIGLVAGGTFEGAKLRGIVLPGGADWIIGRSDGVTTLDVRIGIATGLVVVGDLIGSGEAQERGIVGETPNLAARLQALAEPNMVVIAEGTRRLLGNLFELQHVKSRRLKGVTQPVLAWLVRRANPVENRFEALRATALTPLVGREEEMDLLQRRWTKAVDIARGCRIGVECHHFPPGELVVSNSH